MMRFQQRLEDESRAGFFLGDVSLTHVLAVKPLILRLRNNLVSCVIFVIQPTNPTEQQCARA